MLFFVPVGHLLQTLTFVSQNKTILQYRGTKSMHGIDVFLVRKLERNLVRKLERNLLILVLGMTLNCTPAGLRANPPFPNVKPSDSESHIETQESDQGSDLALKLSYDGHYSLEIYESHCNYFLMI